MAKVSGDLQKKAEILEQELLNGSDKKKDINRHILEDRGLID